MTKPSYNSFLLTKLALQNKVSVFVVFCMIVLFGIMSYITLPKEDNPDVEMPYIHVGTMYPGVSPEDMENLVTKPLEKELKGINELKKMESTSFEGYSSISLEFQTSIAIEDALQKVRDKVSISKSDLPEDTKEPLITELSMEQVPAMIVSISGDVSLEFLKKIAEELEDDIEPMKQVLETVIVGGLEREIQVIIDNEKLEHYQFSFGDVISAISEENITMPGGKIALGDSKYLVRIPGEFKSVNEIPYLIVSKKNGNQLFLNELARVVDGYKNQTSKSRYKTKNSVSILIKRKTGENLIELSDNVKLILKEFSFPESVSVALIGDRADSIRSMVNELTNSIITGMLLVILVLLFFLGFFNAVFVGIAIPLSMLMSFIMVQALGMTLNMVVLFSLILALGMLVDNGIVIVENIYRHMQDGESSFEAALNGTSEVAWPVIGSTLTTVAAFFPMVFWPGMMGGFMKFLPITLIISLTSSLLVAFCITPVLCETFMKVKPVNDSKSGALQFYERLLNLIIKGTQSTYSALKKSGIHIGLFIGFIACLKVVGRGVSVEKIEYSLHLTLSQSLIKIVDQFGLSIFLTVLGLLSIFVLIKEAKGQISDRGVILLLVMVALLVGVPFCDTPSGGIRLIGFSGLIVFLMLFLKNLRSMNGLFWKRSLLIYSFLFLFFGATGSLGSLDTVFFPSITPERILVQLTMPEGTSLNKTDSVMIPVESFVYDLTLKKGSNIKHFVTNIGTKSSSSAAGSNDMTHVAEIQIDFYKPEERAEFKKIYDVTDKELDPYTTIEALREFTKTLSGGIFSVIEASDGPASGKPVSLVISGDDFAQLKVLTRLVKQKIRSVEGLVNLEDTLNDGVPELSILIDRERAAFLGVSTLDIANTVRTAVNGLTASTFREKEDDVDIVVRLEENQVENLDVLRYLLVPGESKKIPLGQVATIKTAGGLGAITRENNERIVKILGDVSKVSGRTPVSVIHDIETILETIQFPDGYSYEFKGEQEDQAESQAFLSKAFLISICLISLILISQFNSVMMPFIILVSVVLSFIGVVWGLFIAPTLFQFKFEPAPFVVIMSGVGIISLAGVVVNNAIVLLDYILQLRQRGETRENAIIKAGVVRFRPVMLTAITTILGLIPMSAGISFDFIHRKYGIIPLLITNSSSTEWWAPLSNAVMFGLLVATALTLVMVPVLYALLDKKKDLV